MASHEERLSNLEHNVEMDKLSTEYRFQRQDAILIEIKNVLIKQAEVLEANGKIGFEVVKLESRLADLETKLTDQQTAIEKRATAIDNVKEFMDSLKGMIRAAAFFLVILQGMIGWFVSQNTSAINQLVAEVLTHSVNITRNETEISHLNSLFQNEARQRSPAPEVER